MPPSLRQLLDRRDLSLRLIGAGRVHDADTDTDAGAPDALDGPVTWVSGSDLLDPTPFLVDEQVLLTTGTWLTGSGPVDVDAYVARLVAAGVTGIGFGTEVVTAGTPEVLVRACADAGMPLFEVPYRTPFIAVIRYAADLIAEAERARDTWAINAQRAISFAALRPDATPSILAELSRQLGRWVALFDARGALAGVHGVDGAPGALVDAAGAEALRLLQRGQRSSATITTDAETVSLQTLGRRGDLRGVLAIGGVGALDGAAQTVVTSVVALAGLSLEQGRALSRATGTLRSGLLAALLGGAGAGAGGTGVGAGSGGGASGPAGGIGGSDRVSLVRNVTRQLGTPLPAEPVRVAVWTVSGGARDVLLADLEGLRERRPGAVFAAALGGEVIACLPADIAYGLVREIVEGHDAAGVDGGSAERLHAGLSDPVLHAEVAAGLDQARLALDQRSGDEVSVTRFSDLAVGGVLGLFDAPQLAAVAQAVLQPVLDVDRAEGANLLESVSVWLSTNGQWDPAAKRLGIHRHTLRARITRVEQLTGHRLDAFEARTNLWLAIRSLP